VKAGAIEGALVGPSSAPAGPSTEIQLRGLVKSFRGPDGPIRAVRGVNVSIAAGETVALLGPNGAGKSTTIGRAGVVRDDERDALLRRAHRV
jgi:ABC-2 type transport system ATP-binding protein